MAAANAPISMKEALTVSSGARFVRYCLNSLQFVVDLGLFWICVTDHC